MLLVAKSDDPLTVLTLHALVEDDDIVPRVHGVAGAIPCARPRSRGIAKAMP
jgi:hypothetical protein